MSKLLVNPDEIGNLVSTRASQIGANSLDRLKKFNGKITGEVIEEKSDFGSLTELINSRRDDSVATTKRTNELNILKGIKPPPDNKGPVDIAGSETGLFRGGGVFSNPTNLIPVNRTANDILRPPDIPGYKETSASQDAFSFLKGLVLPSVKQTKETYLASLKNSDPEKFKKYEDAMTTYNNTKTRIGLTSSSNMDMGIHKW